MLMKITVATIAVTSTTNKDTSMIIIQSELGVKVHFIQKRYILYTLLLFALYKKLHRVEHPESIYM